MRDGATITFKACSSGGDAIPDLRITATAEPPPFAELAEAKCFYRNEGDRITEALCASLPGGTIDGILLALLERKTSIYRVLFPTPATPATTKEVLHGAAGERPGPVDPDGGRAEPIPSTSECPAAAPTEGTGVAAASNADAGGDGLLLRDRRERPPPTFRPGQLVVVTDGISMGQIGVIVGFDGVGETGVPMWRVQLARPRVVREDFLEPYKPVVTPWLPELMAIFGWQGGTVHQALAEVRATRELVEAFVTWWNARPLDGGAMARAIDERIHEFTRLRRLPRREP